MMEITETLYVKEREAWRSWLAKNYDTQHEIWLIYYKKHTGRPRIPYDDAVEEALCFGWIDSTVKRVDNEIYVQRFTPRKKKSAWSGTNLVRAKKMIELGKMTDAGLSKIDLRLLENPGSTIKRKPDKKLIIPSYVVEALDQNLVAKQNFNILAPSYRRHYIEWITSAKKEETRRRRLAKALAFLKENKKLPMM